MNYVGGVDLQLSDVELSILWFVMLLVCDRAADGQYVFRSTEIHPRSLSLERANSRMNFPSKFRNAQRKKETKQI